MTDAFDLNAAQIVNAPDVKNWPITAEITKIWFDGSVSRFAFTKQDGPGRWPDVRPAGWDGDLQYTVWLFRLLNGVWVGSAFIQFWYGRDGSGDPSDPDVPSLYDKHWYYADQWAPLYGSGPIRTMESIGFMVTSGNARYSGGPYGPQERSNVVILPATDSGVFPFPLNAAPPVDPPGPIIPAPGPDVPPNAIQTIEDQLAAIAETLKTLATKEQVEAVRNDFKEAVSRFDPATLDRLLKLFGRAAPPKKTGKK